MGRQAAMKRIGCGFHASKRDLDIGRGDEELGGPSAGQEPGWAARGIGLKKQRNAGPLRDEWFGPGSQRAQEQRHSAQRQKSRLSQPLASRK